jgi:DNA-binding MarR family transcriptional regulator
MLSETTTKKNPGEERERILLEQIERDPDITQASMAAQLGVAVGTVNWYIKRFIDKGYVKVKRAQRRKLRYIITPQGISHRAVLTVKYVETSMRLYRRIRTRVSELLQEIHEAGYDQVSIDGDGDIADICHLTCLEHNIKVITSDGDSHSNHIPVLKIHGTKVQLQLEASDHHEN